MGRLGLCVGGSELVLPAGGGAGRHHTPSPCLSTGLSLPNVSPSRLSLPLLRHKVTS